MQDMSSMFQPNYLNNYFHNLIVIEVDEKL